MATITTIQSLLKSNGSAQPVMVALMPSELSLIASAPDLLEALQKVLPRLSHKFECWSCRPIEEWEEHGSASFENCECEIKTARAAIAKALGEQA